MIKNSLTFTFQSLLLWYRRHNPAHGASSSPIQTATKARELRRGGTSTVALQGETETHRIASFPSSVLYEHDSAILKMWTGMGKLLLLHLLVMEFYIAKGRFFCL